MIESEVDMKKQKIAEEIIEESDRNDFERELCADNLRRGRTMAFIVIGFETIFLLSNFIVNFTKLDNRFHFVSYAMMYSVMILLNIAYLVFTGKHPIVAGCSDKQVKLVSSVNIIYVTLVLSWGSVITLMDQRLYGQLMSFMTNIIVCSACFIFSSKKFLIPYTVSSVILVALLPFFQSSSDILIGHYVNLFVFISISWVISRLIYRSYSENFISKKLLGQANRELESIIAENKLINRQLTLANDQLKDLALLDDLTGIPNRRSFREFFDRGFKSYIRDGSTLSIIMIDIDLFKQFNDYYGHDEGDRILIAVANQINTVVEGPDEFVARWGGEEFIYAAFNRSPDKLADKAEAIRAKIAALGIKHYNSPINPNLTVSMGVGSIPVAQKTEINKVINIADRALYLAKASGRNCTKFLDSANT